MADKTTRVQAILTARDDGMSDTFKNVRRAMQEAEKESSRFKDTMLGMMGAQAVMKGISKTADIVRDSVGRAFGRIDTMNNFKRTMSLMTGDAEKAKKALADIGDTVKGTAYGLDVAAQATQGLVTSGIKLGDATRYIGGWADAVSTFGTGTNEQLSNVMYQLSQMAAKGKANLGDLKSAMEAGIPVVRLYAEATGQSTEEVSNQISAGKISAEEFLKVLDRAFREGTQSFAAIEGAAKKAGDSWAGSFSNMRAAVVRGVQGIIEKMEEAAHHAGLPTMKEAVVSFGKVMESVLGHASTIISGFIGGIGRFSGVFKIAFSTVSTLAGTVMWALERLSGAAGTLFMAFAGYKTIEKAGSALKKFQNFLNLAKSEAAVSSGVLDRLAGKTLNLNDAFNIYKNMISTQAGAQQILNKAQELGIDLNQKNLMQLASGRALRSVEIQQLVASTGAMSAKGVVVGVLTGQINLLTLAQQGLSAAWSANPIGVAIAGFTVLSGVVGGLIGMFNKQTAEQKRSVEEAKNLASETENLVGTATKAKNAYEDQTKKIRETAKEAKNLVGQLASLQTQTTSTASKQATMQSALERLKELYPDLNEKIAVNSDKLKANVGYLAAFTKEQKEIANLKVVKDHYQEVTDSISKLETQLKRIQAQQQIMKDMGTDRVWNGESEAFQKLREAYEAGKVELQALQQEQQQFTHALEVAEERKQQEIESTLQMAANQDMLREKYALTQETLTEYYTRTGESLDLAGEKVLAYSNQFGVSTDEIIAQCNLHGITLDEWAAKQQEATANAAAAYEQYREQVTSAFDAIQQREAIGLEEMIANLNKNAEAMQRWTENTALLMQAGVDEGIIKQLEAMGPAGADQAQRLVDEIRAEIEASGGKWEPGASESVQRMNDAYQAGFKAVNDGIKTIQDARSKIIEDNQRKNEALTKDHQNNLLTEYQEHNKKALEEQRQAAQKTVDKQKETGKSVTDVMNSMSPKILDEAKKWANNTHSPMNALPKSMQTAGENAADGVAIGIRNNTSAVRAAANLADRVNSAFRARLDIHSPSRVMAENGQYTVQGLIEGIHGMQGRAEREASALAARIEQAANPQMSFFGDALQGLPMDAPKTSLSVSLSLGGNRWKAFVEDITATQDRDADLTKAYA